MAPELFAGEIYDNTVDMWALGVMYYRMLTGEYPYKCLSNPFKQLKNLESYKFRSIPGISKESN
jgi:serine/threonine protein kinase